MGEYDSHLAGFYFILLLRILSPQVTKEYKAIQKTDSYIDTKLQGK